jgi:hypothetical protein
VSNRTTHLLKYVRRLIVGDGRAAAASGNTARAAAMFEPLEGRQLMSATPVSGPTPCQMQNVMVTSVTQPPPAGVALLGLIVE